MDVEEILRWDSKKVVLVWESRKGERRAANLHLTHNVGDEFSRNLGLHNSLGLINESTKEVKDPPLNDLILLMQPTRNHRRAKSQRPIQNETKKKKN